MELYIGGCFQGKFAYVSEKKKAEGTQLHPIADGADCTCEEALQAGCINHFHLLLKRLLEDGSDTVKFTEQLLSNSDIVIICDEVGMGVVPLEPKERDYREAVGRSLCMLAAHADLVERIVCGIGQVMKQKEKG